MKEMGEHDWATTKKSGAYITLEKRPSFKLAENTLRNVMSQKWYFWRRSILQTTWDCTKDQRERCGRWHGVKAYRSASARDEAPAAPIWLLLRFSVAKDELELWHAHHGHETGTKHKNDQCLTRKWWKMCWNEEGQRTRNLSKQARKLNGVIEN